MTLTMCVVSHTKLPVSGGLELGLEETTTRPGRRRPDRAGVSFPAGFAWPVPGRGTHVQVEMCQNFPCRLQWDEGDLAWVDGDGWTPTKDV